MSKVMTLEEAAALVDDGDVVALQNMATQAAPMAIVRELIRQEKRGLGLVCLVGGMAVDWLAAAGVIDRFIGAAVSMEQFGLCQQYRKAVEEGRVRVEELSETALNARLGAGARNLPFLPTRGLIGTDLIDMNENLKLFQDPFTGETLVACRALVPDVALVHAHRADEHGNVQYEPTILWPDLGIFPKAARKTIVTVEEIVDSEVLRRNPDRTVLPGFRVDAVVEVPYGAHPTSLLPAATATTALPPRVGEGRRATTRRPRSSSTRTFASPETQAEYLDAVGGTRAADARCRGYERRTRSTRSCARRSRRSSSDGDEVCNGMASFIPVAAIMLARRTHAPGLVWLAGAAGARPAAGSRSRLDARGAALARLGHVPRAVRRLLALRAERAEPRALLRRRGPARHVRQREQLGHRRRLPPPEGAAARHGGARRHGLARQAPLLLEPEPQPALARREAWTSARRPATWTAATSASELGLRAGPELVVTNLAVLDFEPESKRMRLVSVHPGVTVEQVQEATGFELLLPDGDVPETTAPTAEQVRPPA